MFRVLVTFVLVTLVTASPARDLDGRIIGGNDIPIELVPYQVSLFKRQTFFCGGSIISKNYVLTAKHCIIESLPEVFSIRAGTADLGKNENVYQVVRFITYKSKEIRLAPDIALVEVSPPFEFDETRAAIPLFNSREEITPKSLAFVTGWGKTATNATKRTTLQGVFVPMISKMECNKAYKFRGGISAGEICAVHPNGGKDACQGDSGGPLAINGRLAGIVSWGISCAKKEYPGVYVEVSRYAQWIRATTQMDEY